ncbi:YadA-like family protein [Neisseria mucosa]|uniref:YadA-like family protein n=1 Tax=Neisseria mucosa TaxID=488 RepID=UPI00280AD592|nr:YadA-like family protein [Neisseria mucosa]
MKLNLSVKPLCLVLSLVFANVCVAEGIATGAMHKNGSAALGKESKAGENATALGDKSAAVGYKSVAAGYDSNASGLSASAFGSEAKAEALRTVAVGFRANAKGTNDIAVGGASKASGGQSVAVGLMSQATGLRSIAVGESAKAADIDAVAFGRGSEANALSSTAVGDRAKANGTQAVALASAAEANGYQAVAVGTRARVRKSGGTALGAGAAAFEEKSAALGYKAEARQQNSVALGTDSVADTAAGVAGHDFATGAASTETGRTWVSTLGAVSVGSEQNSRQITNVAAGKEDTDAVNVAQVKSLARQTQSSLAAAESNHQTQIAALRNEAKVRMDKLEERTDSGSAAAIAVGSLGQAYQPGQGAVSVASGIWRGKSGYAVGISKVSASGKWLVKGSAVGAAKGGAGGGASVTYLW